ncbi:DUF981 domain-containing protein [Brevibacterium sp. 91QC2O2]|uniref:DUF981 domain-containing protein n=1 Tax=Brevibacterium sp. 91QC2O2 TaxID=2968458 RepID=UPI00211CA081|nr:DUF981 domain-containing protein [Brevibacterium sp. 91QC2O2]MCQ9367500.1 DUF981 domain-containing protein [Brevibacterium sp. 91QC2O2]
MGFFTGEKSPGMIDWATMPTYNTIMSTAAGVGLLLTVWFFIELRRASKQPVAQPDADPTLGSETRHLNTTGWALAFLIPGAILFIMGLHMALTWPLAAGGFPFDNVIFGEPSIAFGALLIAAAVFLFRRGARLNTVANPLRYAAQTARPVSLFIAAIGLALIAIAFAGVTFQLFAAPPQEPISGNFAAWPWLEASFISLVYALIGIGAILFPFSVTKVARAEDAAAASGALLKWNGVLWIIPGIVWVLFGALNFYTHIGLIVNTM